MTMGSDVVLAVKFEELSEGNSEGTYYLKLLADHIMFSLMELRNKSPINVEAAVKHYANDNIYLSRADAEILDTVSQHALHRFQANMVDWIVRAINYFDPTLLNLVFLSNDKVMVFGYTEASVHGTLRQI